MVRRLRRCSCLLWPSVLAREKLVVFSASSRIAGSSCAYGSQSFRHVPLDLYATLSAFAALKLLEPLKQRARNTGIRSQNLARWPAKRVSCDVLPTFACVTCGSWRTTPACRAPAGGP